MDNLVYVWPDGTRCSRENLEEMLKSMPDNYEAMTEQEYFDLYPEMV